MGEKPNYFDVTVWDKQGENCAQYLSKGRPVAVDGRLDWREWDAQDGTKRQAVQIIAEHGPVPRQPRRLGGRRRHAAVRSRRRGATADADMGGSSGASDDDIPF